MERKYIGTDTAINSIQRIHIVHRPDARQAFRLNFIAQLFLPLAIPCCALCRQCWLDYSSVIRCSTSRGDSCGHPIGQAQDLPLHLGNAVAVENPTGALDVVVDAVVGRAIHELPLRVVRYDTDIQPVDSHCNRKYSLTKFKSCIISIEETIS